MARTQRQHDADLSAALLDSGRLFDFFRAVSMIDRLGSSQAAPIGALGPVAREPVLFNHDPSFNFAATDIGDLKRRKGSETQLELTAAFLGLVGTTSPLPTHYAEELFELDGEDGKSALVTLYDILHHRLYSLFYRAGRKYRLSSEVRSDGQDPATRRALAFVGVDAAAMPDGGLPAAHLLGLAPLLAIRSRSGRALKVLLESTLPGVPVEVEGFVLRTVVLDESERNKLGEQNSELGMNFTIGARVKDRSGRFRTRLGPVSYEMLEELMPNGKHHDRLREMLDQFTRGILEAEVEVVLSDDDTPRFRLGSKRGSSLGLSTILGRMGEGPGRVRFTMSADPAGVKPQFIGPVGSESEG